MSSFKEQSFPNAAFQTTFHTKCLIRGLLGKQNKKDCPVHHDRRCFFFHKAKSSSFSGYKIWFTLFIHFEVTNELINSINYFPEKSCKFLKGRKNAKMYAITFKSKEILTILLHNKSFFLYLDKAAENCHGISFLMENNKITNTKTNLLILKRYLVYRGERVEVFSAVRSPIIPVESKFLFNEIRIFFVNFNTSKCEQHFSEMIVLLASWEEFQAEYYFQFSPGKKQI